MTMSNKDNLDPSTKFPVYESDEIDSILEIKKHLAKIKGIFESKLYVNLYGEQYIKTGSSLQNKILQEIELKIRQWRVLIDTLNKEYESERESRRLKKPMKLKHIEDKVKVLYYYDLTEDDKLYYKLSKYKGRVRLKCIGDDDGHIGDTNVEITEFYGDNGDKEHHRTFTFQAMYSDEVIDKDFEKAVEDFRAVHSEQIEKNMEKVKESFKKLRKEEE